MVSSTLDVEMFLSSLNSSNSFPASFLPISSDSTINFTPMKRNYDNLSSNSFESRTNVVLSSSSSTSSPQNNSVSLEVDSLTTDDSSRTSKSSSRYSSRSKKRRRLSSSTLSFSSSIISAHINNKKQRNSLLRDFEIAFNHFDSSHLLDYLEKNCDPSTFIFQLDLSALTKPHNITIFREIRGIYPSYSYLKTIMSSIPDLAYLIWEIDDKVLMDGTREITGMSHLIGKRIYDIVVKEKNKKIIAEQEKIESALAGLTSLFNASQASNYFPITYFENPSIFKHLSKSTNSEKKEKESEQDEELSHNTSNIFKQFTHNNIPNSSAQSQPQESSGFIRERLLSSTKILITENSNSVEFSSGSKLEHSIRFNHKATLSWTLNSNSKITRMKFVFLRDQN